MHNINEGFINLMSRQRLFKCIDNTINSGDTVRVSSDYSQASILVIFINDEEEKTGTTCVRVANNDAVCQA